MSRDGSGATSAEAGESYTVTLTPILRHHPGDAAVQHAPTTCAKRKASRVAGLMLRCGRLATVTVTAADASAAKPRECFLRGFAYVHLRIVEQGGDAVANR